MKPIATFGHEVLRLVALAYRDFADESPTTIARDVFLDGLYPSFQVPLLSKQETASACNCYGFGARSQTVRGRP